MRAIAATLVSLLTLYGTAAAIDVDAARVKRERVFAFAAKPVVTRDGDRVTITFETKAFCDVTVAIEEATPLSPAVEKGTGTSALRRSRSPFPRIVRHLASGVLGPNAPDPFRKNALKQTVVWDGKDELERYVDDPDKVAVRVSLGLKPRLERTLYWSPGKRTRGPSYVTNPPVVVAAAAGVYVYDGGNGDHLRLFDHEGNYVRTIYPFPADKVSKVKGLTWRVFPQDGARLPVKGNLPVADTLIEPMPTKMGGGSYKLAMAVRGKRLVLAGRRLIRMAADGTSGDGNLVGPRASVQGRLFGYMYYRGGTPDMSPQSIALSPDGKWAYCTAYGEEHYGNGQWLCGVTRVALDGPPALLRNKQMEPEPDVFAGIMNSPEHIDWLIRRKELDPSAADRRFQLPAGVACDAAGRVYVADYLGDCIQVFSPEAKLLKRIPVKRPAQVQIRPDTGEIFVFCWQVANHLTRAGKDRVPWALRRLGPFSDPRDVEAYPLPADMRIDHLHGSMTIDFHTDPFTVWVAGGFARKSSGDHHKTGAAWAATCPRLYVPKGRELVLKRHLGREGVKRITFMRPVRHGYQKLYFDQKHQWLFVGELFAPWVFHVTGMVHVPKIDPVTGRVAVVELPFDAEDMAFDLEGRAYLRSANGVARYDSKTWREVPFDYGQRVKISSQGIKGTAAAAAVRFPSQLGIASSQMGGMNVSPRGHLIVTACNREKAKDQRTVKVVGERAMRPHTAVLYPGRAKPWEVHVWDQHGRILYQDAVQGIGCYMDGVAMDKEDNIYVMLAANGLLKGTRYWNPIACTWLKARPGTRMYSAAGTPLPLPPDQRPKRPTDFAKTWVENPLWYRAGVGIDGKRAGCHCASHCRPALDLYSRSFLPEVDRYSVLVLDANGNEVIRIGRYGNVDDGMPLVTDGGPPHPRTIGGDEVAIMHNQMLAVHSDRRLFIGDLGNACIRSVTLDYHATERVALKDVTHDAP